MGIFEQAREIEQADRRRPSLSTVAGVGLGRMVGWGVRQMWGMRVTLGWLVALIVGANVWGWWGVLLVAALAVVPFYVAPMAGLQVVTADMRRNAAHAQERAALVAGNRWLRDVRLVAPSDEALYDCALMDDGDTARLTLGTAIAGVKSSAVAQAARDYSDRFDASSVKVDDLGGGALSITFRRSNPLDEAIVWSAPDPLFPEDMSVVCALDEDGTPVKVSFKEVAGMLVAGLPGSGKTAGVSSFLAAFALSDDVALSVIDCKGGTDWDAYRPRAASFLSFAGEPDEIRQLHAEVMGLRDELTERVRTNKERLGTSNFWNATAETRRRAGVPFRLVVIDEAHEIFTLKPSDKEAREMLAEVQTTLVSLVKRGRSAGMAVLLITQKTTADAVPTSLRDNCATRIAFRLTTQEATRAIMGETLADSLDTPQPTDIPQARKGGAVMGKDTGEAVMVRFVYVPEDKLETLLAGGDPYA